jgi:hypothetical protein
MLNLLFFTIEDTVLSSNNRSFIAKRLPKRTLKTCIRGHPWEDIHLTPLELKEGIILCVIPDLTEWKRG